MKEKQKILFICQEITPYLPETPISKIGRELPQGIQERNREIRTFMPKFGCINERRNQLHEVIRLSGMNLIIDDADHPLIIKVASIQVARMQVYFIDNEDYFHEKCMLTDKEGKYFADNDEKAIFFARGVLETVQKLRWSPDIIHCHGWFTSLVPLLIKRTFKDNPLFKDSKVIYSVYDDGFTPALNENFMSKIEFDGVSKDDIQQVKEPTFENLSKLGIDYSDGLILGSPQVNSGLEQYVKDSNKPYLPFVEDDYISAYSDFYDSFITE